MAVAADIAVTTRAAAGPARQAARRAHPLRAMLRRAGLTYVESVALTIRRERYGRGFAYYDAEGAPIRDRKLVKRLARLAVPPAYRDVMYAEDPRAHLQAIGRDAAGRLQYRYHPDWQHIRETRKAARLARLIEALPRLRRAIGRYLARAEPDRALALAAVLALVDRTAIRAGCETYSRLNGTRGAATLLKSNVGIAGAAITLTFRAKGGQSVRKRLRDRRLAQALSVLRQLPGRRLFQYRDADGRVRPLRRRDVNAFLRETAGCEVTLKDFRTLMASAGVLEALSQTEPAPSARARRRQVLEAVRKAADNLANTPTICRKSYVHDSVITAFENGALVRFADRFRTSRSAALRERVLAQVISAAAA